MKQQLPKLDEEQKLWDKGCSCVVGVDEVGRGPLAGPVIAVACFLDNPSDGDIKKLMDLGIKDSKRISEKKREKIYEKIKEFNFVKFAVGEVDEATIDKINILQASLLAMRKSFENLSLDNLKDVFVFVDGKDIIPNLSVDQKAVVSGDSKIFSIALASIIAKVTRDRIMLKYAEKYPDYFFEKHKGYGTKLHFQMIKKYGPLKIHRKSFLHI